MNFGSDHRHIAVQNGPGRAVESDGETMLAGLAAAFLGAQRTATISSARQGAALPTPPDLELSYRTLLEQIPAVVFMARLDDGLSEAYVSPHIESVLGYSREEWLDDPIRWYHQIHPDDRGRWNLEAASFVLSGQPLRSVYRVLTRDRRIVWFHCEVKMVRREDGQPWFLHGVGIDITDLKTAELELERTRDELERRVQERTSELTAANAELKSEIADRIRAEERLEQRAQELARSNADLEQFAYSASHDLQEPIRNVALSAQLLAREHSCGLDAEGQNLIRTVVANAQHMENLIRDLLEYTHVARSSADDPEEETDADDALQTVLEAMESRIREENAEIVRADLPSIRMPAFRLQQVFQNLISNAIKYRSKAPVRIAISASSQNGSWLFSVSDNGIGIDPKYHERIFGIFKRLHTKDQYPGTGIGLAICKRITENYGGRIWVESEPGRGSTFLFTVPAVPRRPSQNNELSDRAAQTL